MTGIAATCPTKRLGEVGSSGSRKPRGRSPTSANLTTSVCEESLCRSSLSRLSRRDLRTQPGVSTPGKPPPQRPALKGRKIFGIDALFDQLLQAKDTALPPFSISKPLRGCNSDLAQCSNTPVLHHSAWPDSRTRTTTSTSTKRLVRAGSFT